jgi:hypothetical protein
MSCCDPASGNPCLNVLSLPQATLARAMQPPPLNLSLPSSHPGHADGETYNAHSPPIPASPDPEPGPLTEVENQLKELAQSLQAVGNYVQRFHHGIHPTQIQAPGQGQSQGGYTAPGAGRGYGGFNGGFNGAGLEDRPLSKRVCVVTLGSMVPLTSEFNSNHKRGYTNLDFMHSTDKISWVT